MIQQAVLYQTQRCSSDPEIYPLSDSKLQNVTQQAVLQRTQSSDPSSSPYQAQSYSKGASKLSSIRPRATTVTQQAPLVKPRATASNLARLIYQTRSYSRPRKLTQRYGSDPPSCPISDSVVRAITNDPANSSYHSEL